MAEDTRRWTVREATQQDATAWNSFLTSRNDANFYQRYEWSEINRTGLRLKSHFLLVEGGGRIRGVLPLVRVESRLFGRILSSMPFVNFGGPVAETPDAETLLLDAARRYAESISSDYIELRSTRPLDGFLHSLDKVSMTVPLASDADTMLEQFSRPHRKDIRMAQRHGFEVKVGAAELLDDFYDVLAESWHALGTPLYRKSYFATILRALNPDVRIFIAYLEGVPITVAFNGHFGDTVEGMWSGMRKQYRKLSPNYVLYWEMIRWACENGYRKFHLGRSSKDTGSTTFKAKWLAAPAQLYWNYHLVRATSMPGLNPRNAKYARAIEAWRRSPRAVVQTVGPMLARLIP